MNEQKRGKTTQSESKVLLGTLSVDGHQLSLHVDTDTRNKPPNQSSTIEIYNEKKELVGRIQGRIEKKGNTTEFFSYLAVNKSGEKDSAARIKDVIKNVIKYLIDSGIVSSWYSSANLLGPGKQMYESLVADPSLKATEYSDENGKHLKLVKA